METSEDRLLDGRVSLLQARRGHRAGTDAVLLAAACAPLPGERIADLGSASGAVGLMIGHRHPQCRLLFVERDPDLSDLCRRNVAANGMEARAVVIEADLLAGSAERRRAGLEPGTCDRIATNPPFFDADAGRPSPDAAREAAHRMPVGGLRLWIATAAELLRRGGHLVMIHRADRLGACLEALVGFGAVTVRPIYGKPEEPAIRVIVSAVKGSRAATSIAAPLLLHDRDGGFTPEAESLHRGRTSRP